jgi:hypothetical protein
MVGAIATWILRKVLLVVVGAEAFSRTEITRLSRRGHAAGRFSVDVAARPAVEVSGRHPMCLAWRALLLQYAFVGFLWEMRLDLLKTLDRH